VIRRGSHDSVPSTFHHPLPCADWGAGMAEQAKCAHVMSSVTTKVGDWELYMERVAAGWRGAENPGKRLAQTVVDSVFMQLFNSSLNFLCSTLGDSRRRSSVYRSALVSPPPSRLATFSGRAAAPDAAPLLFSCAFLAT